MAGTLNDLLKATSRSFYLTLRVLPAAVRPQIGLAYLLARTTDTIADTELVPLEQRLDALKRLRERILGSSTAPLNFGELAQHQGSPAEARAAGKSRGQPRAASNPFARRPATGPRPSSTPSRADRNWICAGSPGRPPRKIIALETAAELDDYTYRVAGCVGEFWTKICRAHLFPRARLDDAQLLANGIRFGKGLQLVNILRDLPADLKKGRCYLPLEKLEPAGLMPEVLLSPANEAKFLPLLSSIISTRPNRTWQRAGPTPIRCRSDTFACGWPAHGRF